MRYFKTSFIHGLQYIIVKDRMRNSFCCKTKIIRQYFDNFLLNLIGFCC